MKAGRKFVQFIDLENLSVEILNPSVASLAIQNPTNIVSRYSRLENAKENNYLLFEDPATKAHRISPKEAEKNIYLPVDAYVSFEYLSNRSKFLSKVNIVQK